MHRARIESEILQTYFAIAYKGATRALKVGDLMAAVKDRITGVTIAVTYFETDLH